MLARNKRATLIQAWVRMYLARAKYRRDTIEGARAQERARVAASREAAVLVIQAHARRLRAQRRVRPLLHLRPRGALQPPDAVSAYTISPGNMVNMISHRVRREWHPIGSQGHRCFEQHSPPWRSLMPASRRPWCLWYRI